MLIAPSVSMVVGGNYFPLGFFPQLTTTAESIIELKAERELGHAYAAKLCHRKMNHFETFEFVISEHQTDRAKFNMEHT